MKSGNTCQKVSLDQRFETRKSTSSPIDMHTHAGSACDDSMTLTSGILTSRSLMPRDCLSSVVLIAQAYLFLECGHKTDTHRHSLTPMAIDVLLLTVDVVGD